MTPIARRSLPFALAAILMASSLLPATAATITVCPAGCDHATIAAAVAASTPGDVLEIGAGTYTEELEIAKALTLRGAGADDVILQGSGRSSVVAIRNPDAGPLDPAFKVRIESLTITGGVGARIGDLRYGGGVYIAGADVTFVDVTVRDNRSFFDGGGIYNDRGVMIVRDSRIINNRALNGGGGIYNDEQGEMTLEDVEVTGNVARNPEDGNPNEETFANGGGIVTRDRSTIVRTRIYDNQAAQWGGGMYVFGFGRVEMTGSQLISNTAKEGGGLFTSARVTMEDGQVLRNAATDYGGGFYVLGEATVRRSEFAENRAARGGGLAVAKGFAPSQVGELTLERSTIAENTADVEGGGLFAENEAEATVLLATISGNEAALGGGVREDGADRVEITESTIASNRAGEGGGISSDGANTIRLGGTLLSNPDGKDCQGAIRSDGHNLDEDGSCEFTRSADVSSGFAALAALADNGGGTRTHLPGPASDAIDGGHPNRCAETDQRGMARPQDGDDDGEAVCDIGSVERAGAATATPTATAAPTSTATPTSSEPPTVTPPAALYLPRALR